MFLKRIAQCFENIFKTFLEFFVLATCLFLKLYSVQLYSVSPMYSYVSPMYSFFAMLFACPLIVSYCNFIASFLLILAFISFQK